MGFSGQSVSTTGLAHYYQLWTLHNLKHKSGQSVNDFLAPSLTYLDQLSQAKISEDLLHLIQVLMALHPEYEAVRASLLHRHPLPTLDTAIQGIILEETHLNLDTTPQSEGAFATAHSRPSNQKSGAKFCKNCHQNGHNFSSSTIECKYCHELGHVLENCPIHAPRPKGGSYNTKQSSRSGSSSFIAATNTEGSTSITMRDLDTLLKQVISSSSPSPTTLSVILVNSSWLYDSACCNHMTSNSSILSAKTPVYSLPSIHIANGTNMFITQTGYTSAPNISLLNTYLFPNLALSLSPLVNYVILALLLFSLLLAAEFKICR